MGQIYEPQGRKLNQALRWKENEKAHMWRQVHTTNHGRHNSITTSPLDGPRLCVVNY